ncbi:MAG: glycosyl transferase [Bacteroidetes bacterium]|nr:glycosyl transferase [Bacteroidota bacterium]
METYSNISIPTFIINLPERIDRRLHVLEQFRDKDEFDIQIVEGCKHEIGAIGLWMSIRKIVESALNNNEDIIIICEDDHVFTKDYSWEYLLKNIIEAHEQGAELLNGGVGGFGMSIPVSQNRFWVNWFYCTQFIVLYNSVFKKIINEPMGSSDTADGLLSNITSNKMILHPFVSIQKDFGYSDISWINGKVEGHIDSLFQNAQQRLELNRQKFENILSK